MLGMRRREGTVGGVAAWPIAARAQQAAMPVIGWLEKWNRRKAAADYLLRILVGASLEAGYVEGKNVVIEYRWADGRNERFAEIAAEFVRLKVDVIVTGGTRTRDRGKAGDSGLSRSCSHWRETLSALAWSLVSCAAGRQRHRPVEPGADRSRRQAARTLARGSSRFPAAGDLGECRISGWRA